MVGLGTGGVDFAPHLLRHKAQLLTTGRFLGHRLAEVVDVLLQAYFLLRDVEFLKVVDELLFEAVLVDILDVGLGHPAPYAILGRVDAFGFVGRYLMQHLFYAVHMDVEVLLHHIALVAAEGVGLPDGFLECRGEALPVFVAEFTVGSAVPQVGHGGQASQQFVGAGSQPVGHLPQRCVAGLQQLLVEAYLAAGGLFADGAFHLAAFEGGKQGAHLQLA